MESTVWHLSPDMLGVIVAIVVQSMGIAWWASMIHFRVMRAELELTKHLKDAEKMEDKINENDRNYAMILVQLQLVQKTLDELVKKNGIGQ